MCCDKCRLEVRISTWRKQMNGPRKKMPSGSNTAMGHGRLKLISNLPAGAACSTSKVMPTSLWCLDRKSTRLNSSHLGISYAVFCLKKKKLDRAQHTPQYV